MGYRLRVISGTSLITARIKVLHTRSGVQLPKTVARSCQFDASGGVNARFYKSLGDGGRALASSATIGVPEEWCKCARGCLGGGVGFWYRGRIFPVQKEMFTICLRSAPASWVLRDG